MPKAGSWDCIQHIITQEQLLDDLYAVAASTQMSQPRKVKICKTNLHLMFIMHCNETIRTLCHLNPILREEKTPLNISSSTSVWFLMFSSSSTLNSPFGQISLIHMHTLQSTHTCSLTHCSNLLFVPANDSPKMDRGMRDFFPQWQPDKKKHFIAAHTHTHTPLQVKWLSIFNDTRTAWPSIYLLCVWVVQCVDTRECECVLRLHLCTNTKSDKIKHTPSHYLTRMLFFWLSLLCLIATCLQYVQIEVTLSYRY